MDLSSRRPGSTLNGEPVENIRETPDVVAAYKWIGGLDDSASDEAGEHDPAHFGTEHI